MCVPFVSNQLSPPFVHGRLPLEHKSVPESEFMIENADAFTANQAIWV